MQHVNRNSPSAAALRTATAALFLAVSMFSLAPSARAQALLQLQQAASDIQVPEVPQPALATRLSAPGLNAYFINVGQGDAIYLELPGGRNALIDGGPYSASDSALSKFLASKNVTRLDNVVLTHPHADHYNGLKYVFANIPVTNFYDTKMNNTGTSSDEALRAAAAEKGFNVVYPRAGDAFSWGDAAVKVFNSCPEPVSSGDGNAINDCSITLKVTYQDTSMLFVGDAEADVEATMIANYGAQLKSDVLKVGHHGSAYSSSQPFLDAVQPKAAYIEVGHNNYGHPTPSTLNRLNAMGIKVYRTDQEGTMEYSSGSDEKADD